jgi:hypothetical protein
MPTLSIYDTDTPDSHYPRLIEFCPQMTQINADIDYIFICEHPRHLRTTEFDRRLFAVPSSQVHVRGRLMNF